MKVVILAGGLGSRLSEETTVKPKPMVEIGGKPILWHLMKYYSSFGFSEFVIALGYKGEYIKDYFVNNYRLAGNLHINLKERTFYSSDAHPENWSIDLIDTGLSTMTGGRLKRLAPHLNDTFMLTYGDGLSTVNLNKLLSFHKSNPAYATISAVHPAARFGNVEFNGAKVSHFAEKSQLDVGWINGGFMVMEPKVLEYLSSDEDILETTLLEKLAKEQQLNAYRHDGFWQCMDTVREKLFLENMWSGNNAPWHVWNENTVKEVEEVL
jgi:glucose-1-phosphate cytidylyltransferase